MANALKLKVSFEHTSNPALPIGVSIICAAATEDREVFASDSSQVRKWRGKYVGEGSTACFGEFSCVTVARAYVDHIKSHLRYIHTDQVFSALETLPEDEEIFI
jgi:hypothetical protein